MLFQSLFLDLEVLLETSILKLLVFSWNSYHLEFVLGFHESLHQLVFSVTANFFEGPQFIFCQSHDIYWHFHFETTLSCASHDFLFNCTYLLSVTKTLRLQFRTLRLTWGIHNGWLFIFWCWRDNRWLSLHVWLRDGFLSVCLPSNMKMLLLLLTALIITRLFM